MIKTQYIKKDDETIAVILDYQEYKRLKEIEEDKKDYYSALKVKNQNKKWTSHNDLKRELDLK
ncbi:MAG TPA: hypothetical protein PK926_12815 [Spirochaetota bacterium]|nr:hypothetical protein [Spirochaetota bacterium]HPI89921.1 hypothetical protein [Spirochaetota bacterium]HPR49059.1 hypothetical protein [Spirochaetota bacterium]